jgi:hypothetical protein
MSSNVAPCCYGAAFRCATKLRQLIPNVLRIDWDRESGEHVISAELE